MNPKRLVKELLIAKCENSYKKQVKSKKTDYSKWIKEQEEALLKNSQSKLSKINCQTIDLQTDETDGENSKNESGLAEYSKLCKLITISDRDKSENCVTNCILYAGRNPSDLKKSLKNVKEPIEIVIFQKNEGLFTDFAFELVYDTFNKNKNQIMIYSDEDVIDSKGERSQPWFKPDWAPEDFTSFDYFGSFVAIRAEILRNYNLDNFGSIYELEFNVLKDNGAFTKHVTDSVVGHIAHVLYHTRNVSGYESIEKNLLKYEAASEFFNQIRENIPSHVSIIIPSKDHPEVLRRCLESLTNKTVLHNNRDYEIIVVDNGSNDENRKEYEKLVNEIRITCGIKSEYHHDSYAFNFSKMCNYGASKASGNYYLFLNDDMEIVDEKWLNRMLDMATLSYAGAVGAKLLYPPSRNEETKVYDYDDVIQHAGITNLRIGPAHKLQFMSDSTDHYYGRNRFCHDMMGVTGACLLVKKSIFDEVDGFDENLAVAFNDVDLCYKIYEAGFYNIECNDIILYHHESLSRGNDAESKEKQLRLNREKDYLYEKHQNLYGKDPYYNVNLTTDMLENEYGPKYHYEVNLQGDFSIPSEITDVIKDVNEDKCVRIGMECAMDIYKWKYGVSRQKCPIEPTENDLGFYFRGYSFVIGANNACYNKTLLMKNLSTGAVFGVDVELEYRPDIKKNLRDQLNVDLTGYSAKIALDSIPQGEYLFGMYVKDKTSKQQLLNWSSWTIDTKSSSVGETYGL